jgi:hypothetical protein
MELILLIVIAGIVGYLLAGSRLSKPIDQAGEKVADTTRNAAGSVESWFGRTFRRGKKPKDEVVEADARPSEEAMPAAKQPSRRKDEGESEQG